MERYYSPPLIGGGIKWWYCLTSVWRLSGCLSVAYIRPKSRTERPRKIKIGTEVAHITRERQKVKGQCHQAALFIAMLAHQAAAAMAVGTCWPWETAATLPSARRRKALWRPRGRRGAGHIMAAARLQLACWRWRWPIAQTAPCLYSNQTSTFCVLVKLVKMLLTVINVVIIYC